MLGNMNKVLCASMGILLLTNCSSSSVGSSPSLATALNRAVDYMESSLPDVDTASFVASPNRNKFSPRATLEAAWDNSMSVTVTIPGGSGSGCTEPTYNGTTVDPMTEVTIKDYIGMSLDPEFERCSGGGGASENYQPTIFGRLSGAIQIIGYLDNFLPKDSAGVFINGTGSATISVDGTRIDVEYNIIDAASTTYYDKALSVQGYLAGTLMQVFSNLMWIRNNSSELNFMYMESGDYHNGGANGEDGVTDSVTWNILKYNKLTGQMAYEYTSDTASDVPVVADPTNPQLEIFRFYVASTGGEAAILSYAGDSAATNNHTAFAVYAPTGETSSEVTATVNYTDGSDTIVGTTCVALPAATASGTSACGSQTNAAPLSLAGGLVDAVYNGTTGIKDNTTLAETLEQKGFSSMSSMSLDWSNPTTQSSYLTDGASISVGFSSISTMATETDSAP
jgi:hypothetical protein